MMSIYQREISKKSPTRQTWKIRSMSYMGDSVHNVCQKGCMNINWKSLFTKSILFEIHITCIDDYHNALCSGCLNCNWNIMSFRRGVWISTWIAYSSSLDYLNFTLPVLKVNIICLMQWVYEFQLEWYSEGVYESRLKYPIHLVYWNAHSLIHCRLTYMHSAGEFPSSVSSLLLEVISYFGIHWSRLHLAI